MNFHQQVLSNGLEVIAECNPSAISAAIAFVVRAGSRDERPDEAGVSHFLEHMAFKGTDARSADDLNRGFDEIGAKHNAYTTEEQTVYHAAVLPEYTADAIDLLGDLMRPTPRREDFDSEKKVILEEIAMYADSPNWVAYEHMMRQFFLDHPLGNSVLGTAATIEPMTPARMLDYHQRRYGAGNVLVAATGKIDWPKFLQCVTDKCAEWPATPVAPRAVQRTHASGGNTLIANDKFHQQCLLMMARAPAADHPLRVAAEVLAGIIGDDSGSRLYWALGEPGLVDSYDFSFNEYEGVGAYTASASFEPADADRILGLFREVLAKVARESVTNDELEEAKNKLATRLLIAAERPQGRLSSLGGNWCYRRQYSTIDAELAEVNALTPALIRAAIEEFPLTDPLMVTLGPLERMPGF